MMGMRLVLVSVLVVLLFSGSLGQSSNKEGTKKWNSGELIWEDFKGISQEGDTASHFEYKLGSRYQRKKINDTTIIYYEAYAYFDQENSWVIEEKKSDTLLLLNQLLFDLVEVHRRKMQAMYDSVVHPLFADSLATVIQVELEQEISALEQEFIQAENHSFITSKSDVINRKLDNYTISNIPSFTKHHFGYGLNASFSFLSFNNSLGSKFTNGTAVNIGMDFQYKKLMFGILGSVGWNKVKKDFTDGELEWKKGFNTGLVMLESTFAYDIQLDKTHLKPFIGGALFEIAAISSSSEFADHNYVAYRPTLGLIVDYAMRKAVKLIPSTLLSDKQISQFNIRFKLSVTPLDFGSGLDSNTINLSVGISNLSHVIKLD